MARSLVAVQNNVICDAVKYLILNAQQPDGVFREVGNVYHGEMMVRTLISSTSVFNLMEMKNNITNFITIYKYNNIFAYACV